MAGGSFASDPSFDAYNQQTNPAMASYFQTMGQLERSRGRLMEVSQGVMGAVPGAMNMAQSGLMRMGSGSAFVGGGASAFHSRMMGSYNQYQGPLTGRPDYMSPSTAIAGWMGGQPFIQGRHQFESGHIARDIALQNFNIGFQDSIRTGLTSVLPQAAMMGGFMMGGPWGAAIGGAGAVASVAAPLALRAYGIDAQLHSERFRRQIQLSVGERLGDMGGPNRFRLGRDAAATAGGAVTDYVSGIQRQYGMFAPEAKEFEPLVQAAINTTSDKDLPKILKDGAAGLKRRIGALRDAAAVLNTNFEEIAQLATEFGEDSETGAGGKFDQFVQDLNRSATRGRGLNRRALGHAALQARDQAVSQGFQGEASQRGLLSLAADIQQRANQGLIERDYLFAFGGRNQAEASINTAMATQQMERNMATGPFGMMAQARMRGGGGIHGGIMGGAAQLGQEFASDPFGFRLQQYNPEMLTRMGQEAPNQMYSRFRQTFGMGKFGQLAFLNTLQQQTGMNDAQAMSQLKGIRGERYMLSQTLGPQTGMSEDRLMDAYLTAKRLTPGMTVGEFSSGGFTVGQIESLAAGDTTTGFTLGAGGVPTTDPRNIIVRSDQDIADIAIGRASNTMNQRVRDFTSGYEDYGGYRLREDDTMGERATMWAGAFGSPVGSAAAGIYTFGRDISEGRNPLKAGGAAIAGIVTKPMQIAATVGRSIYGFFSGEQTELVEEERKQLVSERAVEMGKYDQLAGYEGTTRYLETNMDRLKALGIFTDTMGREKAAGRGPKGTAQQFLYGLYRNTTDDADKMRTTLLQGLAAESPEKAEAMKKLWGLINPSGNNFSLRLKEGGTAGEVAAAMMELSPEALAASLTAAGIEGELGEFAALKSAFETGDTKGKQITAKELKAAGVQDDIAKFANKMLTATGTPAELMNSRFFSSFHAGANAHVYNRADAVIQNQAFAKMALMDINEKGLLMRTTQ